MQEKQSRSYSGYAALPLILLGMLASFGGMAVLPVPLKIVCLLALITLFVCLFGCFMVQPNQGRVLTLFGEYKGTEKIEGLRWANPLLAKRAVSLRIRNFNGDTIKVNDQLGSPIEIGCVIVWRVIDTAEAVFEVDDFEDFVHIQSESALRNLATSYPYDQHQDNEVSLRSHSQEIAEKLQIEVQQRLEKAGVEVIEARISHLAYAPEIANAMLQRQQATAIIAARQKIVEGAVGMVEMALDQLSEKEVVELDDERKAAMISNLLVVLCSDQNAHPVVNAGSIY